MGSELKRMRKRKYFRKGIALSLAAILLGGQMTAADGLSDIPHWEETAADPLEELLIEEEPQIEITQAGGAGQSGPEEEVQNETETVQPVPEMEEPGTGGDPAAAEETPQVSEDDLFTEAAGFENPDMFVLDLQEEKPEVAAELEVSPAEAGFLSYDLKAKWSVGGTGGAELSLALGMDLDTYHALPEEAQADDEGICRFASEDGTSLDFYAAADERGEDRLLLIYDQTGDGELALNLSLDVLDGAEDSLHTVTAEWYCAETDRWEEAARTEVVWTAAPAEAGDEEQIPEEESPVLEEEPLEMIPAAEEEELELSELTDSQEEELESEVPVLEEEAFDNEEKNSENAEVDEAKNMAEEPDEASSRAIADIEGEAQTGGIVMRRAVRALFSGSVDMTDYITDASFSSTSVEDGKSVKVSLSYQMDSSVLKAKGTNQITYQLPEGINPILDYSGNVYNRKGEVVGTYTVSKEGLIAIDLNESFVDSGETITGGISFRAKLDKTTDDDSEKQTYTFSQSNKIEAEITITKKPSEGGSEDQKNYDVNVDKTYEFDSTTNKASYKVTIGSEAGTGGDFSFEDYLTKPDDVEVQVTDLSVMGFIRYDKEGNSETLNAGDYFKVDEKGNITLLDNKKLPGLGEGCRYELVYDVTYNSEDLKKVNGDVKLSNTAKAWDDHGHQDQSTVNIEFNHTYISKTAYYDKGNDKIVWTITLNDFGHDINGYVLKDTLKKDGSEIRLPESLNVVEYLPDGSQNSFTIQMTDGEYTFQAGEGGVKDSKSKFVITYETSVADAGFHSAYNNEAAFQGNDSGTHTANPGDVHVTHSDGIISKSIDREKTTEDENGNKIYTWNVTLMLPAPDGIQVGAFYTDNMTANANNQWLTGHHYMTAEQLKELQITKQEGYSTTLNYGIDYKVVKVKGSGGDWSDYDADAAGPFTDFKIEFLRPIEYGQEVKINISYQTTASTPDGKAVLYKNEGTFEQNGGSTSAYDEEKESKGGYIIKVDKGGSGTNTYEYDECKGILYYCIMVNTTQALGADDGPIVVEDTLPEGTTLYTEPYDIGKLEANGFTINDSESHVKLYFGLDSSPTALNFGWNRYDGGYRYYKISEDQNVKINYDNVTNHIRIEIPHEAYYGNWSGQGYGSKPISIYYAAKLTSPPIGKDEDGNKLPYKTYTNQASINIKDNEYTDSVTNTVTTSIVSKQLRPDGNAADNETSYRVLINPEGAVLNGGKDLELVDSITYSEKSFLKGVSLKPNSLHLYNLLPDGSNGAEINQALYTVSYEEKGSGENKQFEMSLKVKDNTPYVLEYTYVFAFDAEKYFEENDQEQTVSTKVTNGISVNGSTSGHNESEVEDEYIISSSEASADTSRITVIKVDEDNNVVTLKGASFRLDKLKDNSTSFVKEEDWEKGKIYVTGLDGTTRLSGIKPGVAYRLEEIEAPTNYEQPTEKYTYFYVAKDGAKYPEGFTEAAVAVETEYLTITNRKTTSDYTSIDVQKLWLDAKDQALAGDKITDKDGNIVDSIEITLWQTTSQDGTSAATECKTVILSHDDNDNWFYAFNNLPVENEQGDKYYYYVTETGNATVKVIDESGKPTNATKEIRLDTSYLSSIDPSMPSDAGTFTLKNTKLPEKTDISVVKKWNGDGPHPDQIPVTLYRSKSGEIPEDQEEPETPTTVNYEVIYTSLANEDETFSGQAEGTVNESNRLEVKVFHTWYALTEPISVMVSYDGGSTKESIGDYSSNMGDSGSYYSTFNVPLKGDDIKLYIGKLDNYNINFIKADINAEGTIISNGSGAGISKKPWNLPVDSEFVSTVYLGSSYTGKPGYDDTGWKYTWSDLDDSYYYYVLENGRATSISGYDAEYEYTLKEVEGEIKPIDCVTITNTPNGKTIFTVIKEWKDFTPDGTYTVTAQLYKEGEKVGKAFELTSENNWTETWEDLEEGNYTVQEVKVTCKDSNGSEQDITSGFDVTYSNKNEGVSNNGTITITNTKKSQGITLPGTGSKYPFIYYGLGLAFLLVSTVWMLLTLRKRNTPIDAGKGGGRSKNKT